MGIFEQSFSKAVNMFENDERFKAVERDRDRRDLFDNYLEELKNKVNFCCLNRSFSFRICMLIIDVYVPTPISSLILFYIK
jgi:hypothetical protein